MEEMVLCPMAAVREATTPTRLQILDQQAQQTHLSTAIPMQQAQQLWAQLDWQEEPQQVLGATGTAKSAHPAAFTEEHQTRPQHTLGQAALGQRHHLTYLTCQLAHTTKKKFPTTSTTKYNPATGHTVMVHTVARTTSP